MLSGPSNAPGSYSGGRGSRHTRSASRSRRRRRQALPVGEPLRGIRFLARTYTHLSCAPTNKPSEPRGNRAHGWPKREWMSSGFPFSGFNALVPKLSEIWTKDCFTLTYNTVPYPTVPYPAVPYPTVLHCTVLMITLPRQLPCSQSKALGVSSSRCGGALPIVAKDGARRHGKMTSHM